MHNVEFIPADWLERSAWAACCGERLEVYSRPVQIERRQGIRRSVERLASGRRASDQSGQVFESLQVEELALV